MSTWSDLQTTHLDTTGSIPPKERDFDNARALAADLRLKLRGEVRFDDGSRALYATHAGNYRHVPIGVVVPRDEEDVVRAVEVCHRHGAPVLPRGGGTSLAGQCCNVAVVLDFTKYMHDVLSIDPHRRVARVQPGCVLDHLRSEAARHGLTFGPDPATHDRCTLGGMLGNDSCGMHAQMAGRTGDNTRALRVLTYDGAVLDVGETSDDDLRRRIARGGREGRLYAALASIRDRYGQLVRDRFPKIPRRVSGYSLDELLPERGFHVARALVGSEGTCATILEAELDLVPLRPERVLVILGYPDIYQAGDDVPRIVEHGPIALEAIDDVLVSDARQKGLNSAFLPLLPDGRGFLVVELGADDAAEAVAQAHRLMDQTRARAGGPSIAFFDDRERQAHVWAIRESGLGATARVPGQPDNWPGWEDSAVPPERVGEYLRVFRRKLDEYGYRCPLYGHFGQGCIHTRIDFRLNDREGVRQYRRFVEEMSDVVVAFGGSLSGEHGDGQARGELLVRMYGSELVDGFRAFKRAGDPDGTMNPGKVVDARPLDGDLRLGPSFAPPEVRTHFRYRDDDGSFLRATTRCVGVGKCRQTEHGTMCPSYMITREEMHSTRGRAHLLFEMLEGEPIGDGWHDEHVKEALDLCLACKGCKGECPLNVDLPTLKAEFLSHYYEGRLRPRHAYAFGLVDVWARLGSWLPRVVNFVTSAWPLAPIAKAIAGVAQARALPKLAPETFRASFRRRTAANPDGPKVILWPDTFNDHFHPDVLHAAIDVLEAAGFHVTIPRERLCCGRPLYDYGMLDRAKGYLVDTLRSLAPELRAGVPIVGLEPSCVATFRDEILGLFPDDPDAARMAQQTKLLSELVIEHEDAFRPVLEGRLARSATVHGHCHHKALLGFDAEAKVLSMLGVDAKILDSGCCGMAGAFGYEADKYEVSMACGERALLPSVRAAPDDELVVADGFSCRNQIAEGTDRRALHLAHLLQMALREGPTGPEGPRPEARWLPDQEDWALSGPTGAAVLGAALLGIGGLALVAAVRRFAYADR